MPSFATCVAFSSRNGTVPACREVKTPCAKCEARGTFRHILDDMKRRSHNRGRPRALTEAKAAIIEAMFREDATIKEACAEAEISEDTYHRECKRNEVFLRRMERAKLFPLRVARQSVIKHLAENGALALRYLERRDRRYNPRFDHTIHEKTEDEELDELEYARNIPSNKEYGNGLDPLPTWNRNE